MMIGVISEVYGGITTPPQHYGGIGASVYNVVEWLVRRGYDVTLFAIRGSHTSGNLVTVPSGDASFDIYPDKIPPYVTAAINYLDDIDVWYEGSHHKRFARWCLENRPDVPVICPSWNPNAVDLPQNPVFQSPHMYKAITGKDGGDHIPWFWFGLPLDEYEPCYEATGDAVSINVIAEHKGTDLLVAAAAKYGFPVELYGPIDRLFFRSKVRKHMRPHIHLMGEVGEERIAILQQASMSCTLAIWPEPGSRVTLESLALGCPCMVTEAGALPYYIDDGVNGAIVGRDPESIYAGYQRIISGGRDMRVAARKTAEELFDMDRFIDNLTHCFERVIAGERWTL